MLIRKSSTVSYKMFRLLDKRLKDNLPNAGVRRMLSIIRKLRSESCFAM